MHVCMTFLLIAPLDLPKEKSKSGRLALRGSFATLLCCKGLRPTRLQNSPKSCAAFVDAGRLVLSSSVNALGVDAPLLFPISIIKKALRSPVHPLAASAASLCGGGRLVAIWRWPHAGWLAWWGPKVCWLTCGVSSIFFHDSSQWLPWLHRLHSLLCHSLQCLLHLYLLCKLGHHLAGLLLCHHIPCVIERGYSASFAEQWYEARQTHPDHPARSCPID